MKTAKEHYEEYKNSHPSATWKLDKMYEDAFEKGKEEKIAYAIELLEYIEKFSTNYSVEGKLIRDKLTELKSIQDATKTN